MTNAKLKLSFYLSKAGYFLLIAYILDLPEIPALTLLT